VDEDYVVKIYRRLEPGLNPEIEMGRFLTEVAGFANTPALLGTVELVEGEQRSAIGIVHAFVVNQGDAWTVSSGYLDRFAEEQRLLKSGHDTSMGEEQVSYLRYMSQTGRRVAEMHIALGSNRDLPAFTPEPTTPDDVKLWKEDILIRAGRVAEALRQRRSSFREADHHLIDQFLSEFPSLPDRLNALLPDNIDGLNIRHHGDFHLGQMLIVKDDIFIIDFEGEPRRTIAERRRKAPAARDVAGLVRSIDYSATAALVRALQVASDDQGKLADALAGWRDLATEAFLAAYRETIAGHGLWPPGREETDRMLNFFLVEKVLYETEYELSHRPDWLRVPLTGMLRIFSQQANEAS
jgi:maltose alpha-D-glucosyltransferase/alpha-amylase